MAQTTFADRFTEAIRHLNRDSEDYVPQLVTAILNLARDSRASDVHLIPLDGRLQMQWRVDGVLHTVAGFQGEFSTRLIARLKVLAGLLTYRTDVPQEGRIVSAAVTDMPGEVRVTTFPTLFGEKAAVRLFAHADSLQMLQDLELPDGIAGSLRSLIRINSGVILLTGSSGSGKTTTAYACLRELRGIVGDSRALMTLEDPIEVVIPGVTQSQVRPDVGFDLATGLRSMMRQDPDVIMIGEIRDPETAAGAFQAALTGHLVVTTFHAGSSAEAVARLLEMGLEPYLLRSALRAVVCQSLLRRKCADCSVSPTADHSTVGENSGLSDNSPSARDRKDNCRTCEGTGYHGRFVIGELFDPNQPDTAAAILDCVDATRLQSIAVQSGMTTLRQCADQAVKDEQTDPEEVFRVFGVQ